MKKNKPITTRRMPQRGINMFSRRIVITINPYGACIVALAAFIAITRIPYYLLSVLAIISTTIALAVVMEARRQLRLFIFTAQEKTTARLDLWEIDDEGPAEIPGGDNDETPLPHRVRVSKRV